MGIWNKIWGKLQEQTKIDTVLYDTERRLIDLPSLLNCNIKNICEMDELQKNNYLTQLNNAIANYESINIESQKKLINTTDANMKKQLDFEIKKNESEKNKRMQAQEILNNPEFQLHYLINYQNRIKYNQFYENEQLINIFSLFNLPNGWTPEDLITARENLENSVYTLPINEKNNKIDQINRYYEILIDPIRQKAYYDLISDPTILETLNKKINDLQTTFAISEETQSTQEKKIEKENTPTIETENTSKELELQQENNSSVEQTTFENITNTPEKTTLEINNINKDLLEEQKQKIEEELIPNLKDLNIQIKESKNELLIIAKESLIKQHQNILNQNKEYHKILEELKNIN